MADRKIYKNAAKKHHEKPHGRRVPDMPSNDDNQHAPEPARHKDEQKRSHRKEENFQKERETNMKTRIAPTLTVMILAVLFAFSFAPKAEAKSAKKLIKNADITFVDFKPTYTESFSLKSFRPEGYQKEALKFKDSKIKDFTEATFKDNNFKDANFKEFSFKEYAFNKRESKRDYFAAYGFVGKSSWV